jgi:hypothetical protein
MNKTFWGIFYLVLFGLIITWLIYHKESINEWAETPIGELPARHMIGICYFTAWLGSIIGRKRD